MSDLSETDYRCLLTGIQRVHEQNDLEQLSHTMLEVVERLVACEHLTYNELNLSAGRTLSFFNVPLESVKNYLPAFERHQDQHPVLKHYRGLVRRGERPTTRKISDVLSRRAFQRTALYAESLRHLDTEFQMVVPIATDEGKAVGIAINRKAADFSERDRTVLELLRPHLACAYKRAVLRQQLHRLFDPAEEATVAEALREKHGLTHRESQVLFWIIQGKTTPHVAAILDANARTIDKHIEHILAKLGVETRSAAIAMAVERLVKA